MENASKALLIAASILIVILLIAMGVSVFNSTQGTTDSVKTTMTATEIATFNNKFTAYAGNAKSAAQVKALANIVIANNATNTDKIVSFAGKTTANDITAVVSTISSSKNVLVYDNNGDGLIDSIVIS